MKRSMQLLSIGNSFSQDTMTHLPNILRALGFEELTVCNLYIGGCPIEKHWRNLTEDAPVYKCYVNHGGGWQTIPEQKISDTVKALKWDWISIQHGSSGGQRYTVLEHYEKLPALLAGVKALAGEETKIAFNMTWPGEPDCGKGGMQDFDGDQQALYRATAALTERYVSPLVDRISPAGTAIQNARTAVSAPLTRDGYHLSFGLGRYIAGLTFLKALTGLDIDGLQWMPEGVTQWGRALAIRAANSAVETPFTVTPISYQP